MRVLVLHSLYTQAGGEDAAVDEEIRMLQERVLEVAVLKLSNPVERSLTLFDRIELACASTWSWTSYNRVLSVCREYRPDVAHVHNFWTALSPSVHKACHDAGVPTVQTLHNFRLLCANALLLREGKVCEDCVGTVPWRGVVRGCYRGSKSASAAVSSMIVLHRIRNTWDRDVDLFLAPSLHARSKLLLGEIAPDRIVVKPNVVHDPGGAATRPSCSNTVTYVGRLSQEKGVRVLLTAWAESGLCRRGRLLIVGDGPEAPSLRSFASSVGLSDPHVVFTGAKARGEVQKIVAESRLVVLPSLCYETFGNSVVEAFCASRPAVVSDSGALGEIVEDGRTGYTVPAGDAHALAERLGALLTNDDLADEFGKRARDTYLSSYTTERNFRMLMRAYRIAIERRTSVAVSPTPIQRTVSAHVPLQT